MAVAKRVLKCGGNDVKASLECVRGALWNQCFRCMGRAFSPQSVYGGVSWAVGPGWDEAGPSALRADWRVPWAVGPGWMNPGLRPSRRIGAFPGPLVQVEIKSGLRPSGRIGAFPGPLAPVDASGPSALRVFCYVSWANGPGWDKVGPRSSSHWTYCKYLGLSTWD